MKLECEYKAYSGYLLLERGFGAQTASGLIVPASTTSEKFSLVISVGPDCKHGAQPGDLVTYGEGIDIQTKGPNGGQLFTVPENRIGCIKPVDGIYPRAKISANADKPPAEPIMVDKTL